MTNKEIALLAILNGYSNITKQLNQVEDKLLVRLLNDVIKFYSKLKPPRGIDVKLADKYYQKLKQIDIQEFEEQKFSSMIMAILLLDYLVNENKETSLRNKFLHYPIKQMIEELEVNSSFRATMFNHHRVITKMIEV